MTTANELSAAAERLGYHVALQAEDSWSRARTLMIVHGSDGSAVYVREAPRASEDMGPMALVLVAPEDHWVRYAPEQERRWLLSRHRRMVMYDSAEGWLRAAAQLPQAWLCRSCVGHDEDDKS